ASQLELPADDRAVAAVLALPERVTQHRSRRAAALPVVVPAEHAPELRPPAQRLEEAAAREDRVREARLAGRLQAQVRRAPREDPRERVLPLPDLLPHRVRSRHTARV